MVEFNYTTTSGNMTYGDAAGDTVVYNMRDIAWILASTALVLIMIPGVGFFYSGLPRRKNALSMIWTSVISAAVVSFQWFFWGYSLAFSDTGSAFIGDLRYFALKGVLGEPSIGSTRIPALVFCIYQCMFAAITCALSSPIPSRFLRTDTSFFTARQLLLVPSPSAAALGPSSSSSAGPPSFTTPSPAGRGTPTGGPSNWAALTLLVEHLQRHRRPRHLHLLGEAERVRDGKAGVQAAEHDVRGVGDGVSVVWLVWV